ncbi:hypothetical protein [Achromobacter kerstersii]
MANTESGVRRVLVRHLASPAAGNDSIRGRTARRPELDTGNRTSRGEIGLEASPLLAYRKLSIPKLDDVNLKLDEFRHLLWADTFCLISIRMTPIPSWVAFDSYRPTHLKM